MKSAYAFILLVIFSLGAASCSKSNFEYQHGDLFKNVSVVEIRDANAGLVAVVNDREDMRRLVELTSLDYILVGEYAHRAGLPSPAEYVVTYRPKDSSLVDQHIWTDDHGYVYYMVSMSSIYRKHDPAYCQEVRRLVAKARQANGIAPAVIDPPAETPAPR